MLKADVVREQLSRLAGLDVDVTVEAVPGDVAGLRWRTRQRYVELPDGRRGMRKHRSHDVVPVDDCLLEAPAPPSHSLLGHDFSVADDGFWQVHPGAPRVLVETVLDFLEPQSGESVLDLYAGVGLFAALPGRCGRARQPHRGGRGRPDRLRACAAQPGSTTSNGVVEVAHGPVARVLAAAYDEPFDLVVLDPPREGARRKVVEQVVDRAPRAARTSPATRPRSPGTSRSSPSTATGCSAPGVRPVPDDPPRRVRRAA